MPIRPPPAPTVGRKPQTGLTPRQDIRRAPVLGGRLRHLLWLHRQKSDLAELAEEEHRLYREALRSKDRGRGDLVESSIPNPLTGPVRLRPGEDPLLRLSPDAVKEIEPSRPAVFDPARPAIAVSVEFLGAARDLPPLGMIPAVQTGDLFFGWVNIDAVAALAEHKAVVRIEALRTWTPTSNSIRGSGGSNGASAASTTMTGRGVRLAVIDLGFDYLHPALLREVGGVEEVRATWLHDMELPPEQSAPAGALGLRLSGADLQAALQWYSSPVGAAPVPKAVDTHIRRLVEAVATPSYLKLLQQHGTAVTGIAAGNGRSGTNADRTPPVRGIAPEADLALIAIGTHDETRFADSTRVAAAFHAAFEDCGGACVALMANSDNLGPHDGSLDGERLLDELLLMPGRAIVLSAGNFNNLPYHAVAQAGTGGSPILPLTLRYLPGAIAPDSAEVWFRPPAGSTAAATISIKVRGVSVGPPVTVTETVNPVTILTAQALTDGTAAVAHLQRDDEADAHCLRLVIRPEEHREIVESEWMIDVTAEGPVHGWLDRNNEESKRWEGPTAQAGAGLTTLGSPSSAIRPITVGSVVNEAGNPSEFSGCGPLRAPLDGPRKPDLVAVGEHVSAPNGVPFARLNHFVSSEPTYIQFGGGTSYAAPQIAGACALLFEHFGSAATWADIRQAILQATVRPPSMPPAEVDNWDRACGYGMLDIDALLSPPVPTAADLWLPKADDDSGVEPFVQWTFWDSPALVVEDAAGRALDPFQIAAGDVTPARLRLRVGNRGAQSASNVVSTVWWAPLGAVHPLPRSGEGVGAWQSAGFGVAGAAGNLQRIDMIAPGEIAETVFDWIPPRHPEGHMLPHLLLATVDAVDDPYDPADTICAQNNAALLAVAAGRAGVPSEFQILGSEDTDGLVLWCDNPNGRIRVERMPVTALPWREAEMFRRSGRSSRPLYGAQDESEDMAGGLSAELKGPKAVAEITEVIGGENLSLKDGRVTIDTRSRLVLPRLRIAKGARLAINVMALDDAGGAIHMLHLSGGRRVGGGTVRVVA